MSTIQIPSLTWATYGNANILTSLIPLAQGNVYYINPYGTFGSKGNVPADGVVIDNTLNNTPVTVVYGSNFTENIPPYTREKIDLNAGISQLQFITSPFAGTNSNATFFSGAYPGTAQNIDILDSISNAVIAQQPLNNSFVQAGANPSANGSFLLQGATTPKRLYIENISVGLDFMQATATGSATVTITIGTSTITVAVLRFSAIATAAGQILLPPQPFVDIPIRGILSDTINPLNLSYVLGNTTMTDIQATMSFQKVI